jgi:hypothetical protein
MAPAAKRIQLCSLFVHVSLSVRLDLVKTEFTVPTAYADDPAENFAAAGSKLTAQIPSSSRPPLTVFVLCEIIPELTSECSPIFNFGESSRFLLNGARL